MARSTSGRPLISTTTTFLFTSRMAFEQLLLQALEADVRPGCGPRPTGTRPRRRPTTTTSAPLAALTAAGMPDRSVVLNVFGSRKLRSLVTSFDALRRARTFVRGGHGGLDAFEQRHRRVGLRLGAPVAQRRVLVVGERPDDRDGLGRLGERQHVAVVLQQHDRLAGHVARRGHVLGLRRARASRAPRPSSGTDRRTGRARTSPAARAAPHRRRAGCRRRRTSRARAGAAMYARDSMSMSLPATIAFSVASFRFAA